MKLATVIVTVLGQRRTRSNVKSVRAHMRSVLVVIVAGVGVGLTARAGGPLTAQEQIARAHALVALLGAVDGRGERVALHHLGGASAGAAAELLRALPSDDARDDLVQLANTGEWSARHDALDLLAERGAAQRADLERLVVRDLDESDRRSRCRAALVPARRYGGSCARPPKTKDPS